MATIVIISPKGGTGKTTSALVLAEQLARSWEVTIIDADPNRPIEKWAAGGAKPERLHLIADANEQNIVERIETAALHTPFVIVDLEGTASVIVLKAVSRADFVIVPTQGSQLDAEQAGRALRVVRDHEQTVQRQAPGYRLPYAVLLTRTNSAIRTRTLTHIEKGLIGAGITVFDTELNEREAFRAMFSFRLPLAGLMSQNVANLDKAHANAENFAKEVIKTLRENQRMTKVEVL